METTSFFDKCKGIGHVLTRLALLLGVVLFGTAAILFSTTPAQADAPQMGNGAGKYGMSIASVISASNKATWYVVVWDTETGRSKIYYGTTQNGTKPAAGMYNLPTSPL
jgi:hypothetical protein